MSSLDKPHLQEVKDLIPNKYLNSKKRVPPTSLYLIDKECAKTIVEHALPFLRKGQLVCESSAGLGLIASELLKKEIKRIRLYESCSEFKVFLKNFAQNHPERVELFGKDLFFLHRYEFIDRQDHGNRVEQLLNDVPQKCWTDNPVMSIFGTLANSNFIHFLIKSLVLQNNIITNGRLQLFVCMKPKDYIILTAGPENDLHTYQTWSVLFRLFFDYEILDKFPRNVFLPWETIKPTKQPRYATRVEPDLMYFVKIVFKKRLPVPTEHLLGLFAFIMQFYGKGSKKIIPTLEKWVPGSGLHIMIPQLKHTNYFKEINIFTTFGQLSPEQILAVFLEVINHPGYQHSPFIALVENQLIKTHTVETVMDEQFERHVVDDVTVNLNK